MSSRMSSDTRMITALRVRARGLFFEEAAIELLIAHRTWLRRRDFTAEFIHAWPADTPDGHDTAFIDWTQAIAHLSAGRLPCSSGERRILQIAASLARGIPVDLQDALTGLDQANLHLVTTAVTHAGGHRPPPSF